MKYRSLGLGLGIVFLGLSGIECGKSGECDWGDGPPIVGSAIYEDANANGTLDPAA